MPWPHTVSCCTCEALFCGSHRLACLDMSEEYPRMVSLSVNSRLVSSALNLPPFHVSSHLWRDQQSPQLRESC